MKTEHDYFKFYLCRLFEYELNRCKKSCNEKQIFKHSLLYCRYYVNEKNKFKSNMKTSVTLRTLFNTDENIKTVLDFIKNIRICTKK